MGVLDVTRLARWVDYDLTPLGASLLDAIAPLVAWTRTHRNEIVDARATYDDG